MGKGAWTSLFVVLLALLPRLGVAQVHRDVVIDAPDAIAVLAAHALDLGTIAFAHPARTNAELNDAPGWRAIVADLGAAVRAHQRADKRAGVGMRFSHRLMDTAWLTDPQARLELVAVVNRIDRAPFLTEGCGETRLVYRLAWETAADASRLPMTVNLVLTQPGTCYEAWKRWPFDAQRHPERLLASGAALDPALLVAENVRAVEINAQVLRWPSTVQPDLGGHAAYALRVWKRDPDGGWRRAGMENQPDVEGLTRDPRRKQRLLMWLMDPAHLAAVDAGVPVLPDEFLATSAESVAPRGLARQQNRPFQQLFSPADLANVDLHRFASMPTPRALLRRLDTLTCTGCHQANSIAGFHLLGEQPPTQRIDALHVGRSPHLVEDVAQRQADMDRWPEEPPVRRRVQADLLGAGMPEGPCDLADGGWPACLDLPSQPLRCVQIDDPELGRCLPQVGEIGQVCEAGALVSGKTAPADRMTAKTALACPPDAFCQTSRAGFPAGRCAGGCANPPDRTTCTGIPALTPFNACLARHRPFVACVVDHAVPTLVRACGPDQPCPPDDVCARGPAGQGACVPPYFLRQLRVDGHPSRSQARIGR